MTEPKINRASLFTTFAVAFLLAGALTGLGHVLLHPHLQLQTDIALSAALFAVITVVLLAVRGLKMDASYTL